MKRKIIIGAVIAVVACVFVASSVMAQGRGQFTPPTPESSVAQIEQAIKLTPEQHTQILKIYSDASGQGMRGMRGGMMGGQLPQAVQAVLTPEQVTQYNAYALKQQVDRRITQIDEAVTLTADQKTKIVPILEKEINGQTQLFAGMQGGQGDFQAMGEKMQALRDATSASLKTVLTPEQMTKYNAMPMGRGMGGGGMGGGMRGQ